MVFEVISGVKSAAEVHREHNLKSQLLSRWITEFPEKAPKAFEKERRRS